MATHPRERAGRAVRIVSIAALVSLLVAIGIIAFGIVSNLLQSRDLIAKIIGINGEIFLQAAEPPFTDYRQVVAEADKLPGVRLAIPLVEFAAGVSSETSQGGALVRGIREADLKALPGLNGHAQAGSFDGFDKVGGVAIGQGLAQALGLRVGASIAILTAKGARRRDATHQGVPGRGDLSNRHGAIRQLVSSSCRCPRRRRSPTARTKRRSSSCS